MTESEDQHRVFLNKPLDLLSKLHCKVTLASVRGSKVTGGLLAVDPVTDTAVIVDLGDGDEGDLSRCQVTVVPFVNWTSLEIIDASEEFKNLVKNAQTEQSQGCDLSEEDLTTAREKVTNWLVKNGLTAVLRGEDLVIADAVILEPPFTAESCSATNEIILSRVQHILKSMPVQ